MTFSFRSAISFGGTGMYEDDRLKLTPSFKDEGDDHHSPASYDGEDDDDRRFHHHQYCQFMSVVSPAH